MDRMKNRKLRTAIQKIKLAQTIELGPLLKEWREQTGLQQKELAERAGISAQHLCDLENGRRGPSLETLNRLEELC